MSPDEFDQVLHDTEVKLARLRALYEQYFQGIEKTEPHVARKDMDRAIELLRKNLPRNTALRFRMQQLAARYGTYITYWQRIGRQIEEGTFRRDVMRAQRAKHAPTRHAQDDASAWEIEVDVDAVEQADFSAGFDDSDVDAILGALGTKSLPPKIAIASAEPSIAPAAAAPAKPAGLSVFGKAPAAKPAAAPRPGLTAFGLTGPRPQAGSGATPLPSAPKPSPSPTASAASPSAAKPVPLPPGAVVAPKPAAIPKPAIPAVPKPAAAPPVVAPVAAPKVPLPVAKPAAPAVSAPAVPAAAKPLPGPVAKPAIPVVAPKPAPVAPPPAAPVVAASPARAPSPAPVVTNDGRVDGAAMKALYDRYTNARKQNNEAAVRFETLEDSVQKMVPKLKEKYGNKRVDFDVVVQNGRVGLKPKVSE